MAKNLTRHGAVSQNAAVARMWKLLIALLLLPVCVGAGRALWRLLWATGNATTVWMPLLCGAACWLVVFLLLPRPMWLYVFGHELTHALWVWLFGGRVKRFRVSARGGQVVATKINWCIALAPYFFPVYAVLVLVVFGIGHLLWGWGRHPEWLHLFLGAAYAFHVTLTWEALKTEQTDITRQGWLFSAVIIYLGNVLVLLVGLPLLTARVSLGTVLAWWLEETASVWRWLSRVF
jgi:hypothetical protein